MEGRPSRPEETPPRQRGERLAWLAGTIPGLVLAGFVLVVIVVLLAVIL